MKSQSPPRSMLLASGLVSALTEHLQRPQSPWPLSSPEEKRIINITLNNMEYFSSHQKGETGQNTSVHKALRSPLSEIAVRTPPSSCCLFSQCGKKKPGGLGLGIWRFQAQCCTEMVPEDRRLRASPGSRIDEDCSDIESGDQCAKFSLTFPWHLCFWLYIRVLSCSSLVTTQESKFNPKVHY
ncbi:uncharacterized protein [Macaca nemestrina]